MRQYQVDLTLGVFFIIVLVASLRGRYHFINRNYSGIITEIRWRDNTHGLPDIKLNGEWIFLDVPDSKIATFIQVGDSVVKETGTSEIKVYKKNIKGKWFEKIFH